MLRSCLLLFSYMVSYCCKFEFYALQNKNYWSNSKIDT